MGKRKNGEGSFGKKKISGIPYQYFRDANGHYTYGKTMKELKEKLKEQKNEENKKTIQDSNLCTFGEYAIIWLKNYYNSVSNGTYDDYESIIKVRIQNHKDYDLGNHQIKSLNENVINDYLKSLANKYSRGTIVKTWAVIKQIITYGMKKSKIPPIDFSEIKLPKEADVAVKKKEVPFTTESDMDILYEESKRRYKTGTPVYGDGSKVIIFIMYSGVRIGEAVGLKWRQVDIASGFKSVNITNSIRSVIKRDEELEAIVGENGKNIHEVIDKGPKTQNGIRSIPLPDKASEMVKYFYDNFPHKPDDYVFISKTKKPFDKKDLRRTFKNMQKNSGCSRTDYVVHSLRHGYGSVLVSKGVDIKIVSELLGHKKVSTTYDVYIGILNSDKIAAVNNVFNDREQGMKVKVIRIEDEVVTCELEDGHLLDIAKIWLPQNIKVNDELNIDIAKK